MEIKEILFNSKRYDLSFINETTMFIDVHDFTEIDLEDAIDIRNWLKEKSISIKLNKIFRFGNGSTVTKELREFTSSEKASEDTLAVAIIVRNFAQRMLLDYYLKFNRPYFPSRAFSTKEKAVDWIQSL